MFTVRHSRIQVLSQDTGAQPEYRCSARIQVFSQDTGVQPGYRCQPIIFNSTTRKITNVPSNSVSADSLTSRSQLVSVDLITLHNAAVFTCRCSFVSAKLDQ